MIRDLIDQAWILAPAAVLAILVICMALVTARSRRLDHDAEIECMERNGEWYADVIQGRIQRARYHLPQSEVPCGE